VLAENRRSTRAGMTKCLRLRSRAPAARAPSALWSTAHYLSRLYTSSEGGPPAVGPGFWMRNSSPAIVNERVWLWPVRLGKVWASHWMVKGFLPSSTVKVPKLETLP